MMTHILEFIYFLTILASPVPLCLAFFFFLTNNDEKKNLGFAHHLLIFISCWSILETSIPLLTGAVHLLTLHHVLILEIFIFLSGAGVLIFLRRRVPSFHPMEFLRFPEGITTHEKFIGGAIAFMGFVMLWYVITVPITEYDSLLYHLPPMPKWYQTGSFASPEPGILMSRYPFNWEALCFMFVLPFGEDFLVAFPNVIAWLIFGLSVYLLGIRLGARRIHGMAAAAFVSFLPIVQENIPSMHVDLPFAAFFLVSLYFIVSYFHTRSFAYLTLSLTAAGMFLGIKTSGFIYAFLLIIVFIVMFIAVRDRKGKASFTGKFPRVMYIWGWATFLLLGGFWYLKNFMEIGNPLGHVKVQIGEFLLFPGNMEPSKLYNTTLAKVFYPGGMSHVKIAMGQIAARLGVPFAILLFFLLLFFAAHMKEKRTVETKTIIGLSALLVITFGIYWITPYSATNFTLGLKFLPWFGQAIRYAFPFLGIFAAAASAGFIHIKFGDMLTASAVIFTCAAGIVEFSSYVRSTPLGVFWTAAASAFVLGLISIPFKKLRIFYKFIFSAAVVMTLVIPGTYFAREIRDVNRGKFYGDIIEFIEKNTGENQNIGCLYTFRTYLFYGKKLNRRVISVVPKERNLSQLLTFIKENNISVVAVEPKDRDWKERNKEKAELLEQMANPDGPFVRVFGEDLEKEHVFFRLKEKVHTNAQGRSKEVEIEDFTQ